jgi:hypothetical protein
VNCFSILRDRYGAAPNQSLNSLLGERGPELHSWLFPTRKIQTAHFGANGGSTGVDNEMPERSFANVGACVLGCNMFGPVPGDWPDDS